MTAICTRGGWGGGEKWPNIRIGSVLTMDQENLLTDQHRVICN